MARKDKRACRTRLALPRGHDVPVRGAARPPGHAASSSPSHSARIGGGRRVLAAVLIIDAAIAACFTLTVVEPMMVGILGGGIAHLRLANGRHVVIDNQSMAPMATGPTTYTPDPNAAPVTMDAIGRESCRRPRRRGLGPGNRQAMASPIAKIAEPSDAPCTATTSIASSRTGKAMTTSSVAERVSSTQGRARAARVPRVCRSAGETGRAGTHDEGDPRPHHELRQQVAPQAIGAEQVRGVRALETSAADVRERIGQPAERDERGENDEPRQDQPDHERGVPASTGCRTGAAASICCSRHRRSCGAGRLIDYPRCSCAGAGR